MTPCESRFPTTIGGYQVENMIGAGGQSEVFAVTTPKELPPLALKWSREGFTPPWTDPLAAEYRTLSALSHPQLVVPYDFGYDQDRAFMVVERVNGPTLFEGLNHNGRDSLLFLVKAICPVLSFLHHRGIIHRDLKPANFCWSAPNGECISGSESNKLYLLDLGLVSRPRDPAAEGRAGTLHYMAPEVLKEGRVDARSDLYSLGIIFFEWLTGTPPFTGSDAADIINGHISAKVRWPSELLVDVGPKALNVVEDLLAKDPDQRPQNVEEVIARLADVGLPVDPSFPAEQNLPWHRESTTRSYPKIEFPAGLAAQAERNTCIFLSGDPGSGMSKLLDRWNRELAIYGWSVKAEESTLQAQRAGPAVDSLTIITTESPTAVNAIDEGFDDCCHFALRPLDSALVAEYLGNVLFDSSFVSEVLPAVAHLSSGLPEAIDIILAEWIDTGTISCREGSWVADAARLGKVAASNELRGLYGRIVGELTHNQCLCLGYAAVFGPHFSTDVLRRLLKVDDFPSDVVDELFDRGLFIPFADPDEPMIDARFRHPGLAAVWAEDLPPEYRRLLHRKIALALDMQGAEWGKKVHRRLAHHFWESAQYPQAAQAALTWAEHNATSEEAEEAHHHLDLVQSVIDRSKPGPEPDWFAARLAFLRGLVYKASGVLEQAQKNFRRALALTRKSDDLQLQAEAAKNLGDTYKSTRQYAKGMRILKTALRDFQRLGNDAEISRTLNNLGNIAYFGEQSGVASEFYQDALAIQRRLGLKAEMASTLSNLASVYAQQYELEQAQNYMREALQLKESLDQPVEVARTLNNIGVVSAVAGHFEQAASYLTRAIDINESIDAADEWLLNWGNLLEVWVWQAKFGGIVLDAPRVLQQSKTPNEHVCRAHIHVTLARTFHEMADYRSSREHLEYVGDVVEKAGDPWNTVRYFILRTERRLLFGDQEGCDRALRRALEHAEKSGDPRIKGEVYLTAAKVEKWRGEIGTEFFAAGEEAYRLFEKSAGRHRIFELLLITDDPTLSVFNAEFRLPNDPGESSNIGYTGPPGQQGFWLWRLGQKALLEQDADLARRLFSALVKWSEEHGVAELYWRARTEQGILYHNAHDWEMAAKSFGAAVSCLDEITGTIDRSSEREAYLSHRDVKRLHHHLALFSERFAEK